jgi:hypothetical protein
MPHFSGATGPRDPSPDEPGAEPFSVDGVPWVAVRRHEMTRLARHAAPERRLLVHFFGPDGAHRVAVAPNDPTSPDALVALWRSAR